VGVVWADVGLASTSKDPKSCVIWCSPKKMM
jgi:hypothetical protein